VAPEPTAASSVPDGANSTVESWSNPGAGAEAKVMPPPEVTPWERTAMDCAATGAWPLMSDTYVAPAGSCSGKYASMYCAPTGSDSHSWMIIDWYLGAWVSGTN
jgi:hypothetical protein